jgi:hypothetical protein
MRSFVFDDLTREPCLDLRRQTRGIANLFCEEISGWRRRPDLLFDDRRSIRSRMVRRLGFRDIVKTGVDAPTTTSVAARTPGDLTPSVLDAPVTATDDAKLWRARRAREVL